MSTLKLGIVGVGHLGAIHAKLASEIENIELVGVFDLDQSRCQEVARCYGCRAYASLDSLLQAVEAVSIVVPTEAHFQTAAQALEAGCHAFIEKPITAQVHEGKRLVDLAAERGRILQIGHIERFNPAYLALAGIELSPMFIESHRLSTFNPRGTDVSVILDLMIHDIDIILSLIPATVRSIHACGVNVVSEAEDIANVRLSFDNGAVANLTASRISAKDMRKMRLFQKNTYLSIDFLAKKSEIISLTEGQQPDLPQDACNLGTIGTGDKERSVVLRSPTAPEVNPLQLELQAFAEAAVTGTEPIVTGQDGLRALEIAAIILDQIARPAETG